MNAENAASTKTKVREPYAYPTLTRWGTLRELTQGGGGIKTEPVTKRRTRF